MISIRIQQLTKRFGEVTALDGVDLTIEPGELYFLLGPSGCGKTTLLRTIAGFYPPDGGKVWFGEEDVTHLAPHKRNTGMVFQSYALWPHLTVAQNVAFGLEERRLSRGEIDRRVTDALDSVRMSAYAARRINELSGGQQQRVALARALVIRPRCLLLDEPLSNLDAKLRLEMRAEIRRVAKEFQLTTVYVTHDQKEALSIADRIAVLDHGRIAQIGTPQEVYRRPRTAAVASFIGETDLIPGTITRVSADRATAATDCGEITGMIAEPSTKPSIGAKAIVSVRPECWRLSTERVAENCVRGSVGAATYLGEVAQYEFKVGQRLLRVMELNPAFIDTRAKDAYVWARADDVVILPAD